MNKEMVFLMVCCAGIWLLGALFVASLIHSENIDKEPFVVRATPERRAVCIDSDINQKPKDIYIKGYVILIDKEGVETKREDYCSSSGLSVHEMWCYEARDGSGDFRNGDRLYPCPRGCFNGACR